MYKIRLLITLIVVFFVTKSNAQLSYDLTDTAYVNMATNVTKRASIKIINNSATTATLKWRIMDYHIPTDWSNGVLSDWQMSVQIADTNWFKPTILSGDTVILDFQVKRNIGAGSGCAIAKIEYREQGQSNTNITNLIVTSFASPTFCAPLSVDQIEKESLIKLFPNPTNSELNIIVKDNNAASVNIKSIYGKQVGKKAITNFSALLDVSQYVSGIYFAEIKDRQGMTLGISKFVKQ